MFLSLRTHDGVAAALVIASDAGLTSDEAVVGVGLDAATRLGPSARPSGVLDLGLDCRRLSHCETGLVHEHHLPLTPLIPRVRPCSAAQQPFTRRRRKLRGSGRHSWANPAQCGPFGRGFDQRGSRVPSFGAREVRPVGLAGSCVLGCSDVVRAVHARKFYRQTRPRSARAIDYAATPLSASVTNSFRGSSACRRSGRAPPMLDRLSCRSQSAGVVGIGACSAQTRQLCRSGPVES